MRRAILALALALPLTTFASTDYRSLVLQAMKSKSGSSKSEVIGPVADQIRAQINKPNARVQAEVTTLAALQESGCKRMQIKITTPGTLVPTADGKSAPFEFKMALNMCENGMPPGIEDEQQLNEEAAKAQFGVSAQ